MLLRAALSFALCPWSFWGWTPPRLTEDYLMYNSCVATVILLSTEKWSREAPSEYCTEGYWLSRRNQNVGKRCKTWMQNRIVTKSPRERKIEILHIASPQGNPWLYVLRFCHFPIENIQTFEYSRKTLKWNMFLTLCQAVYPLWQTSKTWEESRVKCGLYMTLSNFAF